MSFFRYVQPWAKLGDGWRVNQCAHHRIGECWTLRWPNTVQRTRLLLNRDLTAWMHELASKCRMDDNVCLYGLNGACVELGAAPGQPARRGKLIVGQKAPGRMSLCAQRTRRPGDRTGWWSPNLGVGSQMTPGFILFPGTECSLGLGINRTMIQTRRLGFPGCRL